MAFPYRKTFAPQDQDVDYFAAGVTGDTWTITTESVTDGMGHLVVITNNSATDHAGKTVVLTGANTEDSPIEDTINLPGPSGTVVSTKYFGTLSSAVPSASIGGDTMDIGIGADVVTNVLVLDRNNDGTGFVITPQGPGGVAAGITYTSQFTRTAVQFKAPEDVIWNDADDTALINATTKVSSNYQEVPVAQRIKMSAYNSGDVLVYERNRVNTRR